MNNGDVLKIDVPGRKKVQIGNGPIIEIDVIGVYNAWFEIDRQFRDEQGELRKGCMPELTLAATNFVASLYAPEGKLDPKRLAEVQEFLTTLSTAHVWAFLAGVTKLGNELLPFFSVASSAAPSSRANTELTFST